MTHSTFAERLRDTLLKRGYTSTRSKNGVDAQKVSDILGVSYEMATRYIDGRAVPRAEKIGILSDWLQVSASYLMFGEEEATTTIDHKLLSQCTQAVTAAMADLDICLTTDQASRVVCDLYDEALKGNKAGKSKALQIINRFFR